MKISAIILASGKSERFGQNKMFYSIGGEPVILKTVKTFVLSKVDEIIVCIPKNSDNLFKDALSSLDFQVVYAEGGNDRHVSAVNGLKKATGDVVLIHDGARCFVTKELINKVIDEFSFGFGLIPVVGTRDSVLLEDKDVVYLDREKVKYVQTPQAFNRIELLEIYEELLLENRDLSVYTDNGGIWQTKYPIKTVEGELSNKKITYLSDCSDSDCDTLDKKSFSIITIENSTQKGFCYLVGNGYDMHELVENRPLILGGVNIPNNKGLLGVSDADVVLHALMDSILSALSLPDIGNRFPPQDKKYQGVDSVKLLEDVMCELTKRRSRVENISITILAQKPRLSPYIPMIKNRLAEIIGADSKKIGISATTTEGLGLIGREEGIACYVTSLIKCDSELI